MKKKITIAAIAASVAALAAAACCVGFAVTRETFSLTIDGISIGKEEFLQAASEKKYDVIHQFSSQSGGSVNSTFWETEYDGLVPAEVLADEAVEELKYFHAVYSLALEKGYVDDDTYEGFLERWQAENASRKEKKENGEVIYGLSEYTQELYKEYEMDTLQKQYCEDLDNEGMEVTDEDREAYYQEHIDEYQQDDDRVLDYIQIPYYYDGLSDEETTALKEKLTKIYKQMDETHSLADLAGEDEELSQYLEHADVTADQLSIYSRTISDVLDYGWDLQAGESTAVLDEDGYLYLIECTDRTENGLTPIEDVKDNINKTLREERYDDIIAARVEESQAEGDMDSIYFFLKKHIDE